METDSLAANRDRLAPVIGPLERNVVAKANISPVSDDEFHYEPCYVLTAESERRIGKHAKSPDCFCSRKSDVLADRCAAGECLLTLAWHGVAYPLEIFDTKVIGNGVRSVAGIPKDKFVCTVGCPLGVQAC